MESDDYRMLESQKGMQPVAKQQALTGMTAEQFSTAWRSQLKRTRASLKTYIDAFHAYNRLQETPITWDEYLEKLSINQREEARSLESEYKTKRDGGIMDQAADINKKEEENHAEL